MKQPHITRRQFFKVSAFGGGALAASSLIGVASAPSQEAQATAEQPDKLAIRQPVFVPIDSTGAFGPLTDLSMGWDGTVWGIDAQGAPHIYDPIGKQWQAHGQGVDAAAWVGTTYYWFSGEDVATAPFGGNATAPQPIATVFPSLPDSFKLSVNGAANVNGTLILFNGGRYAPADGSAPPTALTSLTNWPQTPAWVDGVIDAVHSDGTSKVLLFIGAQFITANLQTKAVTTNPAPISSYAPWQNRIPPTWAATGFDAAFTQGNETAIFNGTAIAVFTTSTTAPAAPQYISSYYPTWPAVWHPVLIHAPSGRDGNLWVVAKGEALLMHDGQGWNVMPNSGLSVSVGQDGTVMVGNTGGLFRWNGTGYDPLGGNDLVQVSVGDAGHVWARNSNNVVLRYDSPNNFTPANLGAGVPAPTHIAANADGTLWHCNTADPSAYRLISDAGTPTTSVPIQVQGGGVVTGVNKVATTGFGAALCLAARSGGGTQVYSYDSPYLFKTAANYSMLGNSSMTGAQFAQGLGNLYFVQFVAYSGPPFPLSVRFVALDAHTGREVTSYPPPATPTTYTGMVFDPVNELVYVGTSPYKAGQDQFDQTTPGQLIALDARTLAVKWTFTADAGIDAVPTLSGTQVCFGDRRGNLYAIDTVAALAGAPVTPTTQWKIALPVTQAQTHRVTTPLYANGLIYVAFWDININCNACAGPSALSWASCNPDGTSLSPAYEMGIQDVTSVLPGMLQSPLLGQAKFALDNGTSAVQLCLFVNATNTVYAASLVDPDPTDVNVTSFNLPSGTVVTGFAYDDGSRAGSSSTGQPPASTRLWFGDSNGNLWGLDETMNAVDGTPVLVDERKTLQLSQYATPVLYKDPQGGLTVLFGVLDATGTLAPGLWGYDPSPSSRNVASVATGVTYLDVLSPTVTNGVIWAGGVTTGASGSLPSQVFGIRVDELPQSLRDFVIESQLMQDPDESQGNTAANGPNGPIPPSVARYQTHLTVVDDQKTPLVREAVKIWADAPTTITIDGGSPVQIGPGDAQYASATTGADGALVIVSNATDINTPALRAWASFMDPYERVIVYPDHEWHGRVAQSYADTNESPSNPDPNKPNLQSVYNYKATPLYTVGEKQAGSPATTANAIGQMNKGVSPGGSSQSALAGKLKTLRATDVGSSYIAYTDLTAMHYAANNALATRAAQIVTPVGMSFALSNPNDRTSAPVYTQLAHTDARAAIDALNDPPFTPPGVAASDANVSTFVITRADSFLTFWNWLKNLIVDAFNFIKQIVVSVAEDIYVGIQLVVKGITQVFKAIIKVVEDVVNAIGSFFKMLLKVIEDVIEALSVLFHFGEIMQVHRWMRDQINTNLQQAIGAMQNQVKGPVDQFFAQGEQAIETLFSSIRQKLGINDDTQINSVNSARSTPHTVFTARPGAVGPNSDGSSHAVQCTHTTQKMKIGLPSATQPSSGAAFMPSVASDDDGVLSTFVTSFVNSLQNDPVISTAFYNLKSAISNIGQSQSAGDFFKSALNLLLTIVEDLILGMVAVTQALVDGLIGAIEALINTVVSLLNTPVEIPFLSWLYQLIFGEPLTILNAVSLVAAIPVTIIYRVVEGHYPSQDGITGAAAGRATAHTVAITPDVLKKMQGLIGGTIAIGLGIARGVVDAAGPNPPRIGTIFVLIFGVAYISTFFPLMVPGPTPTADVWAAWGLGMSLALLGTFGVINLKNAEESTQEFFRVSVTFLRVGLGIARFIVFIFAFAQDTSRNAVTDVQFARSLFLELPPMFNWLKLLPEPANIVLTVIDVVTGVVVCALDITAVFLTTARAPRRYYFPFVPIAVTPVTAHP